MRNWLPSTPDFLLQRASACRTWRCGGDVAVACVPGDLLENLRAPCPAHGTPFFSLAIAGVLCLCSVWWQQSGLLHDIGQDFPSELVEDGGEDRRPPEPVRSWELGIPCNWSSALQRGRPGQLCAQTRVWASFLPSFPLRSHQFTPILFFSLLTNKSRLQCSWCCSDSTIRCYVWDQASDQKANAFPQLQNSLSLSDSVVWVSEGADCDHAIGLLEVGTRRCKVVLTSGLLKQRADLI